jgi:hypothetical protein
MKLGAKKSKQNELLDALGPELAAIPTPEISQPATPAVEAGPRAPVAAQASDRGSIPEVEQQTYGNLSYSTLLCTY